MPLIFFSHFVGFTSLYAYLPDVLTKFPAMQIWTALWHISLVIIYLSSSVYIITAAVNSLVQYFTMLKRWKIGLALLMCGACLGSCMLAVTPTGFAVMATWHYRIRVYLKYGLSFITFVSLVYIYKISRIVIDYRFLYQRDVSKLLLYAWQLAPFVTVVSANCAN